MKHPIDLEHWNRKEHFLFFGSMDDPFFGLTTQIDVTSIYNCLLYTSPSPRDA